MPPYAAKLILVSFTSGLLLIITLSPLSTIWFEKISALPPSLVRLANTALWLSLLIPGANTFISWFQGIILLSGKTRGIPEAVLFFLFVTLVIYILGILQDNIPGLYIGTIGFSLGMLSQAAWLKFRSNKTARQYQLT